MKNLAVCTILFATTAVHAESLEEKQFWKGQMDYVNERLEPASKACGVSFTFEFTGKDKLRAEAAKNNNSPNGICTAVIDEVAAICREGDDAKQAVKAKIKGFRCNFQKPRALDLKGGIVTYMGNNEEANFSDWAKPWLKKHL